MAPAVLLGAPVLGQYAPHPIPENERWATITHAGNAPFAYTDSGGFTRSVGRVDHEYQIGRTEITVAEWYEFVQAYAPYVAPEWASTPAFTSLAIVRTGPQTYYFNPTAANRVVGVGWRFAARYANWLHNNKASNADAFENGAYDTSTFHTNPDGSITDQAEHNPGARYWIPTSDEWVKAGFFDPDKHGPGQPGYWTYPTSSDAPPVIGPPGSGQTSAAGDQSTPSFPYFPDVAAYRSVVSPWGLWDMSGGFSEWTELIDSDPVFQPLPHARQVRGSGWYDTPYTFAVDDSILGLGYFGPDRFSGVGFRLSRSIPSPGLMWTGVCSLSFLLRRRRSFYDANRSNRARPLCLGVLGPRSSNSCR